MLACGNREKLERTEEPESTVAPMMEDVAVLGSEARTAWCIFL